MTPTFNDLMLEWIDAKRAIAYSEAERWAAEARLINAEGRMRELGYLPTKKATP